MNELEVVSRIITDLGVIGVLIWRLTIVDNLLQDATAYSRKLTEDLNDD